MEAASELRFSQGGKSRFRDSRETPETPEGLSGLANESGSHGSLTSSPLDFRQRVARTGGRWSMPETTTSTSGHCILTLKTL